MLLIDGDISTTEADEQEQIEENNKKLLYARAMHANHMIQHHMQQIIEHQRSGQQIQIHDQWETRTDSARIGPIQKRSSDQSAYHADD